MLTPAQVWAVVTWERNLSNDTTVKSPVAGTAASPTFADVVLPDDDTSAE
jgi:uncharacterized protein with beta-barrel porin domain